MKVKIEILYLKKIYLVVVRIVNEDDSTMSLEKKKKSGERDKGAYIFLSLSRLAYIRFVDVQYIGTRSQSHKSTLNST